jgi:16S rRNA (guanine966-N2)-methyltransferase
VLDLFAGTGSLGLEALSRGASVAWFVERDARALAALRRNVNELGLTDRVRVIGSTVQTALKHLAEQGGRFGWVFLDPPYAAGEVAPALDVLASSELLEGGAIVVVEHDKRHEPPASVGALYLTDRRYYGDTGVSFYRQTGLS